MNTSDDNDVLLVIDRVQATQIILELAERAVATSYRISFPSAGYVMFEGTASDFAVSQKFMDCLSLGKFQVGPKERMSNEHS